MLKLSCCICFSLLLLGVGASAFAANTGDAGELAPSSTLSPQDHASSGSGESSVEKLVPSGSKTPAPAIPKETLFWLYGFLFVGVGFFAYKFWKRGALVRSNSKQSKLQVMEMRMLGNKQFLLVVEYDGQRMLLGVSPGIIQHICMLGENGQLTTPPPHSDFSELLGSGHTFTPQAPPKRNPAHTQ